MPEAALELVGVTHGHPGRPRVLDTVSMVVPKGRVTVVMGVNGSGKTTLLRIAAGLVRPRRGLARLGDDTPAHVALHSGRIGYIPQQLGLVRSASVLENALLGGLRESGLGSLVGHHAAEVRERAADALALVGLTDRAAQPARTLSGGERQRVAIARTLVQGATVVVADELIASLDATHARSVMEMCRRLAERGVAMLLALHHLDMALAHADEILFLDDGALTLPHRPGDLTEVEARGKLLAGASSGRRAAADAVGAPVAGPLAAAVPRVP